MSLTPSTMLPLGTIAPDFSLFDTVSGESMMLQTLQSDKATVVMFICNHCPYVLHVLPGLLNTVKAYQAQGVQFIAINSNDITAYPDDAPDKMKQLAVDNGFSFPYLFDETQDIAKAYQAACTPDFYIFDADLACVYRGRYDASTPGNAAALNGEDLHAALDSVLAGDAVSVEQKPSVGCNIKWKD